MHFQHVLVTMLNRRLGGRGPFPEELELDEDWLRYRWSLFTRYTVSSVAAQTESDFTWVVLCHPDSPAWFKELTRSVHLDAEVHFSFQHRDPALDRLVDHARDGMLVTRIDSDDAWHRQALERIRSDCEADPYTSELVTFTDGYLLDHRARQMRPYYAFTPPFCTKINLEPNLDPLGFGGNHSRVRRIFSSRSISEGEPMFLVVGHEERHRARAFDPADTRWLPVGVTSEILERDFGITLAGNGRSNPAGPSPVARRPRNRLASTPPRPTPTTGTSGHRVVVSIACAGKWDSVARAVESVLAQTHSDLLVIVGNDSDAQPRWHVLGHIDDPRLVRIDYPTSRGRHFVDQTALMARLGRYFLIHDADGWSEPERLAALLREMRWRHSVAAVSARFEHRGPSSGAPVIVTPDVTSQVTPLYVDGGRHSPWSVCEALLDVHALLYVGGCYGGFPFGYDTFLSLLLRMTGTISHIIDPLYHQANRSAALGTTDKAVSPPRPAVMELTKLYAEAYHVYCEYLHGSISYSVLGQQLRALAWRRVSAAEWDALRSEAERLRWQVKTDGQQV